MFWSLCLFSAIIQRLGNNLLDFCQWNQGDANFQVGPQKMYHCSTIFYQIDVAWFTYWVHAVEYSKPVPGHPNSGQTRGTLSFRSWKRFEKVNNYIFHIILRTSKERGKKSVTIRILGVTLSGNWVQIICAVFQVSSSLKQKEEEIKWANEPWFYLTDNRVCNTHSAQQHSIFCRIVRHAEHWEFGSTVDIKETIQLKI